jgi:hypothetical protein
MKRSDTIPGVEHATATTRGDLRHKLRGAPPNIRRAIDAARGKRGLAPLWASPPAAPTKARTGGITSTLVVAVAPGLSSPIGLEGDALEVPEYISPRGWQSVADQLTRGGHVAIRTGHEGYRVLGYTTGMRFRYRICPAAGMIFELDVRADDPLVPSGAGCSLAFRPREVRFEKIGGQTVRVLDEIELRHIAIIRKERPDRPVYGLARVVRCRPTDAKRTMDRMRLDLVREISAAWPGLRSIRG